SALASPTGTSYSDTGLAAGAGHSYVVRAVDAGGNVSEASAPASARTDAADAPPAAPTGLHATAVGQDEIDLTWTAPPDADVVGYRVFRDGSASALASPTGT